MMKSLAPVALTGIAGVILWKVLQILMAPVIAWIIGVLAIALKVGLVIAFACVAAYGIRRVMQSRADNDAAAESDVEA